MHDESITINRDELFRNIFETSPFGMVLVDAKTKKFIVVNSSFTNFIGYEMDELTGKTVNDITHPDDLEIGNTGLKKVIRKEILSFDSKKRYIRKGGEVVWGKVHVAAFWEKGEPKSLAVIEDITEQKAIEEQLHQSEERLKLATNILLLGIWEYHRKKLIWDDNMFAIHGLSEQEFDNELNTWSKCAIREDSQKLIDFIKDFSSKKEESIEFRIKPKKSPRYLKVTAKLISQKDQPDRIVGTCLDVTVEKNYEARLEQSLAEKDVMIKEIHHRVKNNMQLISSLLSIESTKLSDEKTKRIFTQSSNKIIAMAKVHNQVYKYDKFTNLDINLYIHDLIFSILPAYKLDEDKFTVHYEIDGVDVNLDIAINTGLLINELMDNAIVHGFKGKKRGSLKIGFHCRENEYNLSVSNDGHPLPSDFDLKSSPKLGLTLVLAMTDQIEAALTFSKSPITKFELKFPCQ